jgi:hypothetical protein
VTGVPITQQPSPECFDEWWLDGEPVTYIVADLDGNERAAANGYKAAVVAARQIQEDEGDGALPLSLWHHDGTRVATLVRDERGHLSLCSGTHLDRYTKGD